MGLLDALGRGWWSGWAEFPELVAGGAGLLESLIPGDSPDDPLERLKDWGNEAAQGLRLEGGGGTSTGLLEKIAEGIGAAPGTVASMAPALFAGGAAFPASAAGAAILRPALGFGLHNLVRYGDEGLPTAVGQGLRGAAEGAAFGQIGRLAGALRPGINTAATQLLRKGAHGAGTGTLIGGMTALHGGDLEESVAAGTTMGLLGMLSSGKYKEPAKTVQNKLDLLDPEIREYDLNRPLRPEAEFEPLVQESSMIGGLGSVEQAALRAKEPGSKLRVPSERADWEKLPPEQQEAIGRQYIEQQGEYRPYTYDDMASALKRGTLDPEGNQTVRLSPLDVMRYGKRHFDLQKSIDDTSARLRRSEAAEDATGMQMYRKKLDGLYAEQMIVDPQYKGTASVMGAGLRTIGLLKRESPEWYQAVENWKKKLGDNVSDQVIDLAKMSEGNPELLARLGRAIDTPKLFDYFQEYWINGLLSGIPTQAINTTSNALRSAVDVAEKRIATKMERRAGIITREQEIGENFADSRAGLNSIVPALKVFGKMLNEDYDLASEHPRFAKHMERSKLDYDTRTIPGKAGKIIRFPGTALQAMDVAFKIVAGERYAASTAHRMASEMLKRGEIEKSEFETTLNRIAGFDGSEPHAKVLTAMKENAQRLTFTEPLSGAGGKALKLRDTELFGTRPGVMVFPFVSTPWNVIKQAVHRSPLGLLRMKKLKADYDADRIKPHEYYREVAATSMGTLLTVGLVGLAKNGFITGGGPVNQQDRQNLLSTGWRPYSVKLGDGYYQLQRLEPLGTILGMAGDIAEFGDAENKLGKAMATIKDNVTDKSFLYGLESLAKAWSNPEMFGAAYYRQMTGSLVPTFAAKVAQAVDPYQRHQESLGASVGVPDAMAYRIPGLSGALPPRSTALGEPAERWGVASTDSPLMKGFSAIQSLTTPIPLSVTREGTEVEQEFNRLRSLPGMPPSMPNRSKPMTLRGVGGQNVKLTEEEYSVYDKYHQRAKQHLDGMIKSARWQSIPDSMKAIMMRKVYDKYRDAANREINVSIRRRTTVGD